MNTAIFSDINWLAVLAGGLAYFALGAVWYSFIFKSAWIRLSGINMDDPGVKTGVAQTMIASLVLMIVASLGLGILITRIGSSGWMTGCKVGLLAGICFSATAISISYLYEKKPMGLHLINGLYNTFGCVIAGIIIAVWGK
jgi:nicotinamide mononucleotide (NMN) deamidase PncC